MSFDLGVTKCVACGSRMKPFGDHHCSPEFERRKEAVQRREREHYEHVVSEAQRLSYGLYLMHLCGD